MGKDLGTYFVRVYLVGGGGFIYEWPTSGRFVGGGTETCSPLSANWSPPAWDAEADVISTIRYAFLEGNYSCDCNRLLFSLRAAQKDETDNTPCGETIRIKKAEIINPAGVVVDTFSEVES